MSDMPSHAPYRVVVGHEIEIQAREVDGELFCEFEFEGDKFGGALVLDDYAEFSVELTVAIDTLVTGVAMLAYNELLGTPVFRDEDEQWVGRVSAQQPWRMVPRRPTQGLVVSFEGALNEQEEPEESEEVERDIVAHSLGDADITTLQLTQEELTAITRGEIPDSLIERALRERSTENLLASVAEVLQDAEGVSEDMGRASRELSEVLRRFGVERS